MIFLSSFKTFEIYDYSSEHYVLAPIGDAYWYSEKLPLFHIFNVSMIEEKLDNYTGMYDKMKSGFPELEDKKMLVMLDRCRNYIDQLTRQRYKRSWNILGTGLKFIAGTPDHDDMVLVQQKLNDLIENNNRLSVINTRLARNIESLINSPLELHVEALIEWLAHERSQIIETINLGKMGVLNTAALNLDEIHEIIKAKKKFDAPLMEILEHSSFKIIQAKSIYVLLMKYPKIEQKCKLHKVKSIEKDEGKLCLEEFAAFCDGKYLTVKNC